MDLYYRLNVFPVRVPALRERVDDIPVLVDYFVSRFAWCMGKRIQAVDRRTLDALVGYHWPGNIRELQNVIERGVILSDGDVFRLERDAFSSIADNGSNRAPAGGAAPPDARRAVIESALRETRGRVAGPHGRKIARQGADSMLRITTARDGQSDLTVRLCGQFTSEYVPEIEDAIRREHTLDQNVRLDLSHVTFVDRPAMVFLCAAAGRKMRIENLPSYVRRWIDQERICGSNGTDSR
jgi:hypothetical protein